MVITFANQKGGVGKTTLAIAFANYLAQVKEKQVKVFDFDNQKSFYQKWVEDEILNLPKLYEVEIIDEEQEVFFDHQRLADMKGDSEIYHIFDLAGTLDARYLDLLTYSDFVIVPFEYSDVSIKSTGVFVNLLGEMDSQAFRIFVRSKYDKGFTYKNQEIYDPQLSNYGKILENPVFKRNTLQSINTRRLTYDQKYAVEPTFKELLECIEEIY